MKALIVLLGPVAVIVLGLLVLGVIIAGSPDEEAPGSLAQTPPNLEAVTTAKEDESPDTTDSLELPPVGGLTTADQLAIAIYDQAVTSVVSITAFAAQNLNLRSSGSGWVWRSDGIIITNHHVVECSACSGGIYDSIEVEFSNGLDYDAEILGFNSDADIAALRIDRQDLTPFRLGNSSSVRPGQLAFALGSPFGEDFSITQGIVSAVGRSLRSDPNSQFSFSVGSVIQTDAAINPGNSGGPLLDSTGAVIGVNTQIQTTSGANTGVGFAIPVDLLKRIVPVIITGEEYQFSYIGITSTDVDNDIRERENIPENVQGALVHMVFPRSPAAVGGIRGSSSETSFDGDIISTITLTTEDNRSVTLPTNSFDELIAILELYTSPGDEVVFGIFRDGQSINVPVTLGTRGSS